MGSFRFEIRNDSGSFMSTANINFSEGEVQRVQDWLESAYPPPPATEGWKLFAMAVAARVLQDAYETERQKLGQEAAGEVQPPGTPTVRQ